MNKTKRIKKGKNIKKCTGTIYKINGKSYCVGEKNKRRKCSKKVIKITIKQ